MEDPGEKDLGKQGTEENSDVGVSKTEVVIKQPKEQGKERHLEIP